MIVRTIASIALLVALSSQAIGQAAPVASPTPAPAVVEFTIEAGHAFFDQTPSVGTVCDFDFGDPGGAYNVLRGYNAAHVYEKPGDYTLTFRRQGQADAVRKIHVLPDKRPVIEVKPDGNFVDVLRSLRNPTVVHLAPGATYELNSPVEIKARDVELRPGGPGPAPRIRRSGKFTSSIIAQAMDITFRGLEFDSNQDMAKVGNKKVNYRGITPDSAHISIIGCTFRNFDDAVFCTPTSHGVLVQWCMFTNEVRSCDVWCDGCCLVLLGNKMATSQQEHNIRSSQIGFFNLLLFQNDLTSTEGKETLTFRVGQDLYASHNAFHKGWIRSGPGPHPGNDPMTAAELRQHFVRHVVFIDNGLTDGAWFQINEGSSDVTVRYNRIDGDEKSVPVLLDGPNLKDIHVEENYRVLKGAPTQKPFVRAGRIQPGDLTRKSNKTKLDESAEPTTDPDDDQ